MTDDVRPWISGEQSRLTRRLRCRAGPGVLVRNDVDRAVARRRRRPRPHATEPITRTSLVPTRAATSTIVLCCSRTGARVGGGPEGASGSTSSARRIAARAARAGDSRDAVTMAKRDPGFSTPKTGPYQARKRRRRRWDSASRRTGCPDRTDPPPDAPCAHARGPGHRPCGRRRQPDPPTGSLPRGTLQG